MSIAHYLSAFHLGYLDGINGVEPKDTYHRYEEGWLFGAECREKGMTAPSYPVGETPVKRGQVIWLEAGTKVHCMRRGNRVLARGQWVKVADCYGTVPAYDDGCHSESIPAKSARVIWVGSGNYWQEADVPAPASLKVKEAV